MNGWKPISEPPAVPFGWFPVFARSADPDMPFRNLSFWDGEKWTGLVDIWQNAITHWMEWPADPGMLPAMPESEGENAFSQEPGTGTELFEEREPTK